MSPTQRRTNCSSAASLTRNLSTTRCAHLCLCASCTRTAKLNHTSCARANKTIKKKSTNSHLPRMNSNNDLPRSKQSRRQPVFDDTEENDGTRVRAAAASEQPRPQQRAPEPVSSSTLLPGPQCCCVQLSERQECQREGAKAWLSRPVQVQASWSRQARGALLLSGPLSGPGQGAFHECRHRRIRHLGTEFPAAAT